MVAGRRLDVLVVLRGAAGPRTIGEIADELMVHPNTVRFHLQSLVHAGQVESVETDHAKPGRPPSMFRVVAGMDPAGPRHYRMLADVLVDAIARAPDPAASAIAAGRAWTENFADADPPIGTDPAVERLTGLLAEWGFVPEKRGESTIPGDIGLRNCPFLELARANPEVVCPIHLGLMQGALAAWDAPITVEKLTAVRRTGSVPGPPDPRRGGPMSAAAGVAVAVVFLWFGMVIAISFIEAPLTGEQCPELDVRQSVGAGPGGVHRAGSMRPA